VANASSTTGPRLGRAAHVAAPPTALCGGSPTVDDGAELAITPLRAVGSIGVDIHPLRDEPAAGEIPAPGAQELGTHIEHRFAVLPSATGWQGPNAVARAEDFRNDVLVTRGTAPVGGHLPPTRRACGSTAGTSWSPRSDASPGTGTVAVAVAVAAPRCG
jgi:mannosylglycerate hydrolase